MIKGIKYGYLLFSIVMFIIGFMVAKAPLFERRMDSLDFIGRTFMAGVLLIIGFYGITVSVKSFINEK